MRTIDAKKITSSLSQLIKDSLGKVDKATCNLLEQAAKTETSQLCRWALDELCKNNLYAQKNNIFPCQDCGQAVLFVSIGQEVYVEGNLDNALNKGVEEGYKAARKSVAEVITRQNTLTNTPAVIHYSIVSGDRFEVIFMAKGAGAENMSRIYMLTPSKGTSGIIDSVLDCVCLAGANPCPPIIVGVGIGGTMEKCAILSKLALTRECGTPNQNPQIADLEKQILAKINASGIGAQGFGGDITALAVHIEDCPTHIGMLPVAVNIQCHSARHGKLSL